MMPRRANHVSPPPGVNKMYTKMGTERIATMRTMGWKKTRSCGLPMAMNLLANEVKYDRVRENIESVEIKAQRTSNANRIHLKILDSSMPSKKKYARKAHPRTIGMPMPYPNLVPVCPISNPAMKKPIANAVSG